ncbi:MAG: flagellar assembly protein FliW [Eubacteriales bacterium]|jgi:flagellar assembly factor FliW
MEIKTRDFGQVTVNDEATIHFVNPIFGFDEYTEYVLLSDSNIGEGVLWLQSIQEPDLCFILVDPRLSYPEYTPGLSEEVRQGLSKKGINNPVFWAIAVIAQEFDKSTMNLKSPVIIDPDSRNAAQVILDEDYPIRAPLIPQGKGEC